MTTTLTHALSDWHRSLTISKVASDGVGSLLFFVGSVLLLPVNATRWHGYSAVVGSWMFVVGCLAFLLGTLCDLIGVLYTDRSTVRSFVRVVKSCNAVLACVAAAIFLLGSIFFVADDSSSRGCWSFLIGSVLFCVVSAVDFVFICNSDGQRLTILRYWRAVVAITCFGGAICFVVGSWFYLPRFTAQQDVKRSTHFKNLATSYYTIGSVLFMMNAVAQIPNARNKLKANAKALVATSKTTVKLV